MTKYEVKPTAKFRKDYKQVQKQGRDPVLLRQVIQILAEGKSLPPRYKDHPLQGQYRGHRECHIQDNWLLIYQIKKHVLVLSLRTRIQ